MSGLESIAVIQQFEYRMHDSTAKRVGPWSETVGNHFGIPKRVS